jgi:hypothetical protein
MTHFDDIFPKIEDASLPERPIREFMEAMHERAEGYADIVPYSQYFSSITAFERGALAGAYFVLNKMIKEGIPPQEMIRRIIDD